MQPKNAAGIARLLDEAFRSEYAADCREAKLMELQDVLMSFAMEVDDAAGCERLGGGQRRELRWTADYAVGIADELDDLAFGRAQAAKAERGAGT
jgi:hypothetical protein